MPSTSAVETSAIRIPQKAHRHCTRHSHGTCAAYLLEVRAEETYAYDPLTHSFPHAINTPVLPLKISPCPPTLFNPP